MLTGVSLLGDTAGFVPLLQSQERFSPVALPVWGSYDRLGAIDGVAEGPNSSRVLAGFQQLVAAGVVTVDRVRIDEPPLALETFDDLVRTFDRALISDPCALSCNGAVLSYALVSGSVFQSLLELAPDDPHDGTVEELARFALGDEDPARTIYLGLMDEPARIRYRFGSAFADFLAVQRWMETRRVEWRPPSTDEGVTHSNADRRQFLADARQRFCEDHMVLAALGVYEVDAGLLEGGWD
jgi:hypothetical protein